MELYRTPPVSTKEVESMSTQVVRVQGFSKGSLKNIGGEVDRAEDVEHRNADIDTSLSSMNRSYKDASNGFYNEWNDIMTALNADGKVTKDSVAFEGMVITADKEFFERLGWVKGEPAPKAVTEFFDRAYDFAKHQIGYQGTDKNILSAKVHYDETTPHLQLYYLPITDKWQEKVYQRDADGHVVRNEKGVPQQARGEDGKCLFKPVERPEQPRLARSEFWRVRGGQSSYRQMQDRFHKEVGKLYGLERGEIGSDREHRTKNQFEAEQLKAEKERLTAEVKPYREMKADVKEVEVQGKTVLPGVVAVKKKDLDALKEQAKSYAANRGDIEHLRQRESAVGLRELEADRREQEIRKKERELTTKERRLDREIAKQPELNAVNKQLEGQNAALQLELGNVKNRAAANQRELEGRIAALTRENGSVRAEMEKAVQNLSQRLRGSYESMGNVVKAVGMLKWDKGKYKANLTPEQDRLVEGIANYGEKWAKNEGMNDIAKDIHEHIGISKGIDHEIDALTPQRSRGFEMEH